jgi:hypothetical protein
MKEFIVWFTGTVRVKIDESDVTEDENIQDIATNEFYNAMWETNVEVMGVNSVEEV